MDLRQALGVDLPIVQAPMAGVQGSALAIAVRRGGGLGSLPCALLDEKAMRAELQALRDDGPGPFNVNFFCHRPPTFDAGRDAAWRAALAPFGRELGVELGPNAGARRTPFDAAAAALVEAFRPAVVSFHFGLPDEALLARVRGCGARVFASATTVDEAVWLESRGADAIIAQGLEAGGHRGQFLSIDLSRQAGLFALLPQVVRRVRVPVIAAGGIADAAGVEAALALGAAMVQIGTSYLLCDEATTRPVHRRALADDGARHTALTRLFSGGPARSIVNRLMREVDDALAPAFPLASAALAPLRAAAEARGSGDFSPLWSGQNASGCRRGSATELTRALAGG